MAELRPVDSRRIRQSCGIEGAYLRLMRLFIQIGISFVTIVRIELMKTSTRPHLSTFPYTYLVQITIKVVDLHYFKQSQRWNYPEFSTFSRKSSRPRPTLTRANPISLTQNKQAEPFTSHYWIKKGSLADCLARPLILGSTLAVSYHLVRPIRGHQADACLQIRSAVKSVSHMLR